MFDDTLDQDPDGASEERPDELPVESGEPSSSAPDAPRSQDVDDDSAETTDVAVDVPTHRDPDEVAAEPAQDRFEFDLEEAADEDDSATEPPAHDEADPDAAGATDVDDSDDDGAFLQPLDAQAAALFGLTDEQLGLTRELPSVPAQPTDAQPADDESADAEPATPAPSEWPQRADEPVFARRRRTLFPRWLWPSLIAAIVVIAIGTVLAIEISQSGMVEVPQVVGLNVQQAQVKLAEAGLKLVTTDSRYSSGVPKGGILAQDPSPGEKIKRGSRIGVVVSVGSETVQMPDVIGMPIADAQRVLGSLGLQVSVDHVAAEDATPNVVLSSIPSPGMNVSTSDIVRLTAAGSSETSSGALLPFNLAGTTVAIDPAPVSAGVPDAPVEVARRLRALLEASGARVTVTRSVADTDTTAGTRAGRAAESSPTVVVGLDVASSGIGGLGVRSIPATRSNQANYRPSLRLADAMLDALRMPGEQPTQLLPVDDVIAFATPAPGIRVQLGSSSAPGDRLALTDPDRDDAIARAIYRALGSLYGKR